MIFMILLPFHQFSSGLEILSCLKLFSHRGHVKINLTLTLPTRGLHVGQCKDAISGEFVLAEGNGAA